jgi:hypothetical protein
MAAGVRRRLRRAFRTGARLDLTGARIEMPLVMHECVVEQPIRLTDADLVSLSLDGCTLAALEADGIKVNGDLRVRDATITGNVSLMPARVGGWFARSGPLRAVKADGAPTWDPFLYSVDLLVPLLDLGHDKAWEPVGADKAVALSVMVAGWVLATTVIAGTGRSLGRGGQGA